MQWMRDSIPKFSLLICSLASFLRNVYKAARKCAHITAAKISLKSLNWSLKRKEVFQSCKKALQNQETIWHIDISERLCVLTNAAELLWSGVVTKTPKTDMSLPCSQKLYDPLAFFAGNFCDVEICWSSLKKNGYTIIETVE